jgi:2-dehydropantoate 2-reductase
VSSPSILIVGAGAVGQAYALGLQRAGARVSFFVKPHHVDRLKKGIPVQEVGLLSVGPLEDLRDVELLTDWSAVAERSFHSIWLAVDGTALLGDWVEAMATARGSAAVVAFQTGVGGRERLAALIPDDALAIGMIPFLAWWAPLNPAADLPAFDPPDPPRMRVWHPPLMRTPLSGPAQLVATLVGLLRAGGLPATVVDNADATSSMGSAVLLPIIAGLEVAGWSLRGFASGPQPTLVMKAVQQAQQIAAASQGIRPSRLAGTFLLRPALLRLGARVAPWFTPLDLETYLQVHFTKVGAQTSHTLRALIESAAAAAESPGLPADALSKLATRLDEVRSRALEGHGEEVGDD